MSAKAPAQVASTPEAAPNAGASNAPVSQPGQGPRVTGTRPNLDNYASGFAERLLAAKPNQPSEPPPPAQEAAAPATDPVTGRQTAVAEQAPPEDDASASQQAQVTPPPENVEGAPDDFDAGSLGESLRRLNADVRREVKNSIYRDKEYQKLGFSVDDARFYANAGFTPERAAAILQRMPTAEDDARVFGLADTAVQLKQDFETNPRGFLFGLAGSNPDAAKALIAEAAAAHERINPEVRTQRTVDTAKQLINTLKTRGTKTQNEVLVAAAQILEEDMFGPQGIQAQEPQVPPEFMEELNRYREENTRIREQQQRFEQQRVAGFQSSVVNTTTSQLREHVKSVIDQTRIALPEDEKALWIDNVIEATRRDFVQNPDLVNAFNGVLTRGAFDQQHGNNAVAFALDRAKRIALPHINRGVERYRKLVGTNRPAPPAAQPKPAAPAPPPQFVGSPAKNPVQPAPAPRPPQRSSRPDVDSYQKGFAQRMAEGMALRTAQR